MASDREVDVVIVGAGIAGLSAAEHLWANGLKNFIVLEASDRIGGRIRTEQFGKDENCLVEMGAGYIHGIALTNSMVTLANRFGLLNFSEDRLMNPDRSVGAYRSDGKFIDRAITAEAWKQLMRWTEDEEPPPKVNLEDYFRNKLNKYLKKMAKELEEEDIKNIRCVFNNYSLYMQLWMAASYKQIDSTAMQNGEEDIDDRDLKMSGLSKIVDALRKLIPEDKVLLNQEVKNIALKGKEVMVSCKAGMFQAKQVIVTCSLGFLKENARCLFSPPLPANKQEAIDKTGYGWIGKVYLYWDEPFWTKGQGVMALCYTDEEKEMKSEAEWYKKVHNFDEVVDNDNVLVAWVAYDGVKAMEKLSDDEVMHTLTALLRKFLANPNIPVPSKIIKTNWCSDRLYRGTYSYHGLETKPHHWEDLEAPVCREGEPKILFAGDSMRNSGCMHGARSSALREADRILTLHKLIKIVKL